MASGLNRRGFLRGGVAGTAGTALGAGLLAGGARADAQTGRAGAAAASYPFYGVHQAGILTPPLSGKQSFACFAAFDSMASGRAELTALMRTLTARARFLTAGGVVRDITRHTRGGMQPRYRIDGFNSPPPPSGTPRDLLGFKDGTANPTGQAASSLIWVTDPREPAWARGGSYQVARLIRMLVEFWDRVSINEQQNMFGRRRDSGAPLDGSGEFDEPGHAADPPRQGDPARRAHPAGQPAHEGNRGSADRPPLLLTSTSGSTITATCRPVTSSSAISRTSGDSSRPSRSDWPTSRWWTACSRSGAVISSRCPACGTRMTGSPRPPGLNLGRAGPVDNWPDAGARLWKFLSGSDHPCGDGGHPKPLTKSAAWGGVAGRARAVARRRGQGAQAGADQVDDLIRAGGEQFVGGQQVPGHDDAEEDGVDQRRSQRGIRRGNRRAELGPVGGRARAGRLGRLWGRPGRCG